MVSELHVIKGVWSRENDRLEKEHWESVGIDVRDLGCLVSAPMLAT